MNNSWHLLRSLPVYYLLYGLAFVLVLLIALQISRQGPHVNELPLRAYNNYFCDTGASDNKPTFRILDLFKVEARLIADTLCNDQVIAQQFKRVEVSWVRRDQTDFRNIFEQRYHLLIAKPELLKRFNNDVSGYSAIAHYDNYSSRLIALDSQPQLSAEYFHGKSLGLIDDPNSLSGYQIPKRALKEADIDESTMEIVYFKSHSEIMRALGRRELDLIAAHRPAGTKTTVAENEKSLLLQDQLPGPRWYLHPDLIETRVHCQTTAILSRVALSSPTPYLERLTISRDCSHGS